MGAGAAILQGALDALAPDRGDRTLPASAARVAEQLAAVTVGVRAPRERGGGSGIVWRGDGTVVTNAHVAREAHATVETADGLTLDARVVRRDDARDLAELRVDAPGLRAATIGDSEALRPGQLVLALGHPLGVPGALSLGVVHAAAGRPTSMPGDRRRWVQADIRLAPGNSGGPLADAEGRVIGINSMIAWGMAIAVPSTIAARFASGEAPGQAFLGIAVVPAPVPPAIAA